MHVLSATVLTCLFMGSFSDEISSTSTTSTMSSCKQYGTRYAFTCTLSGDVNVTTGYTMILHKVVSGTGSSVEGKPYKSSEKSITMVVASGVATGDQYRCWVKKDDDTTTSKVDTQPETLGDDFCVKDAKSALVVTKESENKFAFTCALWGNDGIDVSQGHRIDLIADTDAVEALDGVDDSMTSTSITRTAEAYTAGKKYSCKVVSDTDGATHSSMASQALIEAPECSGAAGSVVKSVALTTGCLMVTLLKLSY